MKTIVTKAGLEALKERLALKIEQLKSIREEKAHAYSASGDGWHDNPGWIQLGQQEEMLAHEVNCLQLKLANVSVIDTSRLDTDRVGIGAIVAFSMIRHDKVVKNEMVGIVGSGESDVKNKKISYDSPLGKALLNMKIGEKKEAELPAGKIFLLINKISYE